MANVWRRAGLIVNPTAGHGPAECLNAARTAVERCGVHEVLTGTGQTGADALTGWLGPHRTHSVDEVPPTRRTRALARWLSNQSLDVVIVVGGDGTLADAALEIGRACPVLGIGAGSTNVGRLITCLAADVDHLDCGALEPWSVDALVASVGEQLSGMAFNDVVIAATVIGTVDGRRIDIDALDRMAGALVAGTPRPIGGGSARVIRELHGQTTVVASGDEVGTVVVGFAEPEFFGKAVTGGACLTTLARLPAGCVVSNQPLARIGLGARDLEQAPPVVSRYVSLAEGAAIEVTGIDNAALCVDGNPLHRLEPDDRVSVSAWVGAVVGLRVSHSARYA